MDIFVFVLKTPAYVSTHVSWANLVAPSVGGLDMQDVSKSQPSITEPSHKPPEP